MGRASMKSLSGPAHGLEPTAQQLRPLVIGQTKAPMVERKLTTQGLAPERKNNLGVMRIVQA
jgi:hypothetical protein